jgi:DNA polymerase III subunit epsilon
MMNINNMILLMKQLTGKVNLYTGLLNQTDPASIAFIRQIQKELKRKYILDVPLDELQVVVFDIETTGFSPEKGDQMLSIGAVKVVGNTINENEKFYSLIQSKEDIPPVIEELTRINKSQLEFAPTIDTVLNEFYQFISSNTLVAHHANHEKLFMQHFTRSTLKTDFQHRVIDTSFLTKITHPNLNLVTLDEYCRHHDFKIKQRHHALHDAFATAKLWAECIRSLQEKGYQNLIEVYSHLAK